MEILEVNKEDDIEARKSSGMRIKEWCNRRGYLESRYYYHLRMVRRMKKEEAESVFVLLPAPTSDAQETSVMRDKVIVKYGEYSAEIPDGFGRQTILSIMEISLLNDYVSPGRECT